MFRPQDLASFKETRNEIIKLLRKSKKDYIDNLAYKLKHSNFSSSDYWKTLKSHKTESEYYYSPTAP